MNTQLNSYNFQTIIALNDHLVTLKRVDTLFEYLSNYLNRNFQVNKFSVFINTFMIYTNIKKTDELKSKNIEIKLNNKDILNIAFYFDESEKNNLDSCFLILKNTFSLISQTIYNKYLEFKIKELNLRDSLTGLYNRQYLDEYLKITLPLSNRENKKLGFLKVGIDHFKAVIDEFDYTIGDKVLKELAKSIEKCVRKSDVIARVEGDEFLIVLHNISSEENAIMIAEKIINNFKDVQVVVDEDRNQTLMKTICAGISVFPDDANQLEELFRSSDIALYEARNKGRSQLFKFKKDDDVIELF